MTEICVRFCRNLDLLERFSDKSAISNLTEIFPVGEALAHADIWTCEKTERRMDGWMDGHDEANRRSL